MKREEVKAIFPEANDEQLKAIMDLNGTDAEKSKARIATLEADAKSKQEELDRLNAEADALKAANADGAEWRTKFEALQAENEAKAKQAEAERIAREKSESIGNRFATAVGEKKFTHDAIRDMYLKKFGEALESADYQGKSDSEIFHELTKDDTSAFRGVEIVKLAGGRPQGDDGDVDDAKIRSVMGLPAKE